MRSRRSRSIAGLAASVALLAAGCSGNVASPSPAASTAGTSPSTSEAATPSGSEASSSPAASASASAPSNMLQSVGPGEGQLNLIIWAGYAEDGSNKKQYDWVHPFEKATGCTVHSKTADTSDEMVTLMRSGGGKLYDGVSASGDATNRLIAAGDVAPINIALIQNFSQIAPFLQSPPHNTVNGIHYGVSHGWGGNLLMYRTDKVKPAPTSWDVVFDPAKAQAYSGRITDYDSPIYIADAALYLKAHNPSLSITDPYELTPDQLDAAVQLLKQQHPLVGKYWSAYTDEIDNFTNGTTVVGTSWPYQVNTLKGSNQPVAAVVPTEGMTGWADTWMMSSHAQHPNCMYQWMNWIISPQAQAGVAESFGEAPANPSACPLLDKGVGPYAVPHFCDVYRVTDQSFYKAISFWKTPLPDCGDSRGTTCTDYNTWTAKWAEIKG